MCWRWKYTCGHTADIECRAPKLNRNNPDDANMAYGCFGLPDKYADAAGPCKQCMLEKAPARDERNSKGDNNKSANEYHAGRGNGTWGANMLGDGWLNKDVMGIWPWNKEWMIKLAGMKYDDDGMLVDDPETKIPLETWAMPQNTYEFDIDADYNTLSDDLEALSMKNPAYARIQSSMLMVRPQDPKLVAFIKALGFPNGLPPNIDLSEYSDLLFPGGVVGSAHPASPSKYPDFLFDAGPAGGAPTASPGLSRSSSSSTISKDSAKDSVTVKITPDTPFFPANNDVTNPAAVRIVSEEEYAKFVARFVDDAALDTGSTVTPA